jgi:DNA-directed RNA polymerase specialized sigma24 family protein
MVEVPLRRSLRRFARALDVEVVVQETLLRMWLIANDTEHVLEGSSASLKFAFRVARNVALEEARHLRQERFVDLAELDGHLEGRLEPAPPDPALGRTIEDCVRRLPAQPRKALLARVRDGCLPDREIAASLQMKANTFLQNVVRARRFLAQCLERRGVHLEEILS